MEGVPVNKVSIEVSASKQSRVGSSLCDYIYVSKPSYFCDLLLPRSIKYKWIFFSIKHLNMLKRTVSSKAHRPRTAWFPVILRVEAGIMEVHLCWRYSDTSIGLFSSADKRSPSRPAWDYVKECALKKQKNAKGEEHDYFVFRNRRHEQRGFRADEVNPVLWALNDFTSKIIDMRTKSEEKLLTMYLSLLVNSENFRTELEDLHDPDGFRLDGTGISVIDLEGVGGTLQLLREFAEKAVKCCVDVVQRRDILEIVEGGRAKKGDGPSKVKKSKVERVMDDREEELAAKDGIEKTYVDQYLGRADVHIKNLKVSTKVSLKVIPFKVNGLVKSMKERFDPSQISLTVIPVGSVAGVSAEDLSSCHFEVIHGRHR